MTLEQQLKRDEGVALKAYQDILGFWTIGVGHKVDPSWAGKTISLDEALQILDSDIKSKTSELYSKAPWVGQLDEVRAACLVNMAFNLGVNGLLKFHRTLALVQEHNFSEAAVEMLNSTWATQIGARAQRLSEQMRTGQMV